MTSGKPIGFIIRFAIPLFIGNIFQQIYNFADTALVGQYVGTDALASVGASGSTTFFLISLLMGLTSGASIIIAQAYGRSERDQMCRAVGSLYTICTLLSIVLSLVGVCFTPFILRLLNTPPNLMNDAILYLRIIFIGIPALGLYNAGSAVMRSLGNSVTPLVILILSSFLNIGLDVLFILPLQKGIAGAAAATVISQVFSAVITNLYVYIKRSKLFLTGTRLFQKDPAMLREVFRIGLPTAFQSSLISLGGMTVQGLINTYGDMTIAAYTAAAKIDSIAIQFVVAVGMSISVFTGQNIGSGHIERIKICVRDTLKLQIVMCTVIAAVIVIFRYPLVGFFLKEEAAEAIDIGCEYITIICIAYISAGIMQTFLNVIRGAGDVRFSTYAGLLEVAVRIVFAYLLSGLMHSQTGIWIATPIAWISACIFTVLRYRTGKWMHSALRNT